MPEVILIKSVLMKIGGVYTPVSPKWAEECCRKGFLVEIESEFETKVYTVPVCPSSE